MAASSDFDTKTSGTIFEQLRAIIGKDAVSGWDNAWYVTVLGSLELYYMTYWCRKANITPWDAGDVQPPLADLIKSGELHLPKTGRALVPGCGRVSSIFGPKIHLC